MKLLSLDVSTKTGFAVLEQDDEEHSVELLEYGLMKMEKKVLDYGEYPWAYLHASRAMSKQIIELVQRIQPDVIVVEETNLGKARYSQKLLEFLHQALLMGLSESLLSIPVFYLSTSEWRHAIGMKMTAEDKKSNAKLKKAKVAAKAAGTKVDNKALGIRGKVGWKHLSVRHANATFGLSLLQKDEDKADAICMALGFLQGARPCNGGDDSEDE